MNVLVKEDGTISPKQKEILQLQAKLLSGCCPVLTQVKFLSFSQAPTHQPQPETPWKGLTALSFCKRLTNIILNNK